MILTFFIQMGDRAIWKQKIRIQLHSDCLARAYPYFFFSFSLEKAKNQKQIKLKLTCYMRAFYLTRTSRPSVCLSTSNPILEYRHVLYWSFSHCKGFYVVFCLCFYLFFMLFVFPYMFKQRKTCASKVCTICNFSVFLFMER